MTAIKKALGQLKFDFTIPVPTILFGIIALISMYYDMKSENTDQNRRITNIETKLSGYKLDHDAIVQMGRDVSWMRSIIEKRSTLLNPLPAPFNLRRDAYTSDKDEG